MTTEKNRLKMVERKLAKIDIKSESFDYGFEDDIEDKVKSPLLFSII